MLKGTLMVFRIFLKTLNSSFKSYFAKGMVMFVTFFNGFWSWFKLSQIILMYTVMVTCS